MAWRMGKILFLLLEPLSHLWERVPEGRERVSPKPSNLSIKAKAVKRKIKCFNSNSNSNSNSKIKIKVQSFHSFGASYFSLLVQRKVTKRKHTQPSRPVRFAVGVRSASGIF